MALETTCKERISASPASVGASCVSCGTQAGVICYDLGPESDSQMHVNLCGYCVMRMFRISTGDRKE